MCEENYEFYKTKSAEKITAEEIGERISSERKIRRLTQEDLADKTRILRANIARIESGKHYPSLETLEKIAKALEVPVAKFLVKKVAVV
jgi:transcriptional regulator with XRE-family HTH domain